MDTIIKLNLRKAILAGHFEVASKIIAKQKEKSLIEVVENLAYEDCNLAYYTLLANMLIEQETVNLHCTVVSLYIVPLCIYAGADAVALYHSKRAVKLDPKDLDSKQLVLSFYNRAPETLLPKDEAMLLIEDIFALDPNNINAFEALEDFNVNRVKDVIIDYKDFYSLLYYAKFDEARELVKNISADELFMMMATIGEQEQTLIIYGYVVNLLLDKETAEVHQLASRVLVELLNTIEGAYVSAYWHAKRAVELDTESIDFKVWLLKFKILPGNLLSSDDAVRLARSIIEMDPENVEALKVINQ